MYQLVAESESFSEPLPDIGHTKSLCRFSVGAKKFMNEWSKQGSTHHCAIGVGHIAGKIEKLGLILGIEVVTISSLFIALIHETIILTNG